MTNYDCNSPQKMGWTSLFVRVRGMLVQRVLLDEIPLMPRWIRVLMAHRSCACVLSPSVASKMKESVSEALMRARSWQSIVIKIIQCLRNIRNHHVE